MSSSCADEEPLFEDPSASAADHHDSEENSDQSHVQADVTVEHVAKLVSDHCLELVTIQDVKAASCHADGGVADVVTGGKRVDALLAVQDIHRRDRHSARDRHLFDDIQELAPFRVLRRRVDPRASTSLGHGRTTAAERLRLQEHPEEHDPEGSGDASEEEVELNEVERPTAAGAEPSDGLNQHKDQVDAYRENGHGRGEERDQLSGLRAGLVLMFEEVHSAS